MVLEILKPKNVIEKNKKTYYSQFLWNLFFKSDFDYQGVN